MGRAESRATDPRARPRRGRGRAARAGPLAARCGWGAGVVVRHAPGARWRVDARGPWCVESVVACALARCSLLLMAPWSTLL